jgi:alpha/beta hydrolase fold
MGFAAQEDGFCRKLMNFTDVSVVGVDHRLAPEHPYPTPLEDCYAALRWLADQSWVDATRIAIGGASAGGGFAAALALLARDRGEVAPALQLLVYPMLDDRTGADDQSARVTWSGRDNQIAWRWYLGSADPAVAVPARRTDLAGLRPAWVGVGSQDLFHDEYVTYALRLGASVRRWVVAARCQLSGLAVVSTFGFDASGAVLCAGAGASGHHQAAVGCGLSGLCGRTHRCGGLAQRRKQHRAARLGGVGFAIWRRPDNRPVR